ncbi:MFS transporter [Acidovorax cavernicola]|uniref:MFS transporter n=1 Tax=Acidovorax cavernicola TaxID=1675792 RepID=A0A9X8GUH4_9BURK|nr:MFS transporter [Acidovorax cavernicola]RIX77234.1 MFS transporter [Acidovorax cavernicola]
MADVRAPSRGAVAGFGAGAFGSTLSSGVVPLLFLFYLTEFAKVPPAIAGVLLAIPKLADLLFDPWIGRRTDSAARAMGSRSQLIAINALALPVLLLLLFLPVASLPLSLRLALLGVLLVAQSLMLTVFTVAHTAIASDMCDSMQDRSTLMSSRALGQTIAGLLVTVLAPQIVARFSAFHGGYLGMAAVLAVGAFVALSICWLVVRRVPLRTGVESKEAPSLPKALRATLRNKAFYGVALILVLLGTSSTALFSALPYANKHLLHAGPENLSVLLTPIFLALLLGVTAAPWLARRVRPTVILGGALGLALLGVGWLTAGPRTMPSMVAGGALFGLACGGLTVLISTLAMETATRSSAQGESLGLYLGILFSAEKLGQSLGGIVVGFGLDWVGPLDAGVAQPSLDRLASLWVVAPASVLVIALFTMVPLATRLRAL